MNNQLNIVKRFNFGGGIPLVDLCDTRAGFGVRADVLFCWAFRGVGIGVDVFCWVGIRRCVIIDMFAYWCSCRVITRCWLLSYITLHFGVGG